MGHLKRAKRDMESDKATLVKRDLVSMPLRAPPMALALRPPPAVVPSLCQPGVLNLGYPSQVVRQVEETEQEERARLRVLEAKLRAEEKEKVGLG